MRCTVAITMAFGFLLPCAAQTIEVELIIEAFDGSGCIPSNPPICPEPEDLDGNGCNAHNGSTNDPHSSCSQVGLTWPSNYPNPSVFGPQKIDENWANIGAGVNWFGTNSIKNGSEAPPELNQGSQGASIIAPYNVFNDFEAATLGYISPEDPQDIRHPSFPVGRMLIEQYRQEYNANNPGDLKPEPLWDRPVKLLYDVMRIGDGSNDPDPDPQNPTLKMRADILGFISDHDPIPPEATFTFVEPETLRWIPADGLWHTYEIGEWGAFPEKVYFALSIRLWADEFPLTVPSGQVEFYIDNVRIVYEAVPPDEICDNGIDDDGDGLIDCDDPDCDGHPACPCNRILFADMDFDGDVDQTDFAAFQRCYTGSGHGGGLLPECACFDVTSATPGEPDGSIDQLDFNAFLACSSGPDIPADPGCVGN